MDDLKEFITGFIVRWLLKIGGGFFLAMGISADSVTIIVSSIVSILAGLLISLLQHEKAINTPVPKE
jgi:hypothetical protein